MTGRGCLECESQEQSKAKQSNEAKEANPQICMHVI